MVDVNRIVDYAAGTGKRSFAAFLPENAYGNVVEVAFKQAVARKSGRIVAFEKYGADRTQSAATIAQALASADSLLLADDGDALVGVVDTLASSGDVATLAITGLGAFTNLAAAFRAGRS